MNPHRQIGMQVFFFLLCCFGMRRASEGLFSLFSQVDCCHYFLSRIGNRSVFPGESTHYSKQSTYLMRHDTFYHFSDVCIQCGWHRNVSKLDRPWEKIGIKINRGFVNSVEVIQKFEAYAFLKYAILHETCHIDQWPPFSLKAELLHFGI